MKKIPTLFERTFENHRVVGITDKVTPGFEWVLEGEGVATVKFDGSCCAIINGEFYKRYDAKKGKKPPVGAIPCCDPDPVTGHWPHWVKIDPNDPGDKWFVVAYENFKNSGMYFISPEGYIPDGTYEAVGKHFNGNPYRTFYDTLYKHGENTLYTLSGLKKRSFEQIKTFLMKNEIEGIVFWKDGEPQCKIKRTDFGFEWPVKKLNVK